MQLFVTEYTKKDTTITIINEELLSQLRKVLRAKIGDTLWIQSPAQESKKTRYEVRIDTWDTTHIISKIISEQIHELTPKLTTMIIAMPNKREKAELIVQKLTECGIDQIIFWPSERSVVKAWNVKKEERLHKIIKEALEQSRGRNLPKLQFTTDIAPYVKNTEVIIFDKDKENIFIHQVTRNSLPVTWVIGPEGGLTDKDYQLFQPYQPKIMSLGATILRMETAAIIGGWIVKNN